MANQSADVFSGLLVLVVTDLAGFTSIVSELGDVPALECIRIHNRLLREVVRRYAGYEVTHTGDGMITAFRSVAAALRCAQEIQRALSEHTRNFPNAPLRARVGVHAGEPLPEDGRLFGACVNTAVRVCAHAQAEHVLVTDVVKQLAAGRDFEFTSCTRVELKGLLHEVQLHELACGQLHVSVSSDLGHAEAEVA